MSRDRTEHRTDVLAFGGGTQSVAIGVLIHQGRLPRPAHILMADTGREASATWDYLEQVVRPRLGLEVEVVREWDGEPPPVYQYDHYDRPMMPAYTADGGKLNTACSDRWKKYPIRHRLRQLGYGPDNPVRVWLGISTDEVGRARDSDVKWASNHYPLLYDVPMTRRDCVALVLAAGLPLPPRSSCWMCPNRTDRQWLELREKWPQDWERAVAMDAALRQRNPDIYL